MMLLFRLLGSTFSTSLRANNPPAEVPITTTWNLLSSELCGFILSTGIFALPI